MHSRPQLLAATRMPHIMAQQQQVTHRQPHRWLREHHRRHLTSSRRRSLASVLALWWAVGRAHMPGITHAVSGQQTAAPRTHGLVLAAHRSCAGAAAQCASGAWDPALPIGPTAPPGAVAPLPRHAHCHVLAHAVVCVRAGRALLAGGVCGRCLAATMVAAALAVPLLAVAAQTGNAALCQAAGSPRNARSTAQIRVAATARAALNEFKRPPPTRGAPTCVAARSHTVDDGRVDADAATVAGVHCCRRAHSLPIG